MKCIWVWVFILHRYVYVYIYAISSRENKGDNKSESSTFVSTPFFIEKFLSLIVNRGPFILLEKVSCP